MRDADNRCACVVVACISFLVGFWGGLNNNSNNSRSDGDVKRAVVVSSTCLDTVCIVTGGAAPHPELNMLRGLLSGCGCSVLRYIFFMCEKI